MGPRDDLGAMLCVCLRGRRNSDGLFTFFDGAKDDLTDDAI